MAYKRYIKKNGKKIGPYYYKSVRGKSGKIRTVYLGKKSPERKKIFDDLHHMKFVLFIFMFLGAVFIALNPHTVGFVVKSSQIYTDDISLVINETQAYDWNVSYDGMIKSFKISGRLVGGSARIYINNTEVTLLSYDSELQDAALSGDFYVSYENEILVKSFQNACVETCSISMNDKNIKIFFVLENTTLFLDNITYTIFKEEVTLQSETTEQYDAEVGFPVKWKKTLTFSEKTSFVETDLPLHASNIVINKKLNGEKTSVENEKIKINENEENKTFKINDEADDIEIEYETPPPEKTEQELSNGVKRVTVSSDIHYENVKVSTEIAETEKNFINTIARNPTALAGG